MATEAKIRITREFCLSYTVNERNMKMDSFIYDVDDSGNSLLHLAVESSVFQVCIISTTRETNKIVVKLLLK